MSSPVWHVDLQTFGPLELVTTVDDSAFKLLLAVATAVTWLEHSECFALDFEHYTAHVWPNYPSLGCGRYY